MLSVKSEKKISKDEKYLLKMISREYLNSDIIDREKFYFPVPPLKFIKGEFFDYCRNVLLSESALERKLFNRKYIDELITEPNRKFTNMNGNELWHFSLLERWLQLNLDT